MRIAVWFLLTLLFAFPSPSRAENDQVLRAPVPDWVQPSEPLPVPDNAAGAVFVRYQDFVVHLDADGQANYSSYRIRILHPAALQLGNLSIAWRPSAGPPIVHFIRIHRDGQVVDVLENTSFEILRREDQLEAAMLTGALTAVLRVSDLRVGDELEVGVTTRSNDPTLRSTVSGILLLAPEPPPGRFRLGLNWDRGQEPRLQMTPDMAAIAQRSSQAIDLRFDNPTVLVPPSDAPPRYQWQRILEYSDFPDWAAISQRFSPLYRQAAALEANSPLRSEAGRIAAAHSDQLGRAKAALRLVQQQVRYIYVGLDNGNLTPATADETWRRRYGDCKGKTALLLALLAELGIDAVPVLVNNDGADDGLSERLPSPGIFNHVLVRAEIADTLYWLDGTLPPVAGPSIEPVISYRWILPLTPSGSSIEHRQWRPSERPDEITLHEIDARAGFVEPATITSTRIVRGIAGLRQQVQLSALTPAQLLSAIRQEAIGDTWQAIDDVQWRYDVDAQASVLIIRGTGAAGWDDEGDEAKSLILPGGGFNPPYRRIRPSEQDQTAPYYNEPAYNCFVTTVRLPESTEDSDWQFNTSFDTDIFGRDYYRKFQLRDHAITMIRGSRIGQQEISPSDAARDNAMISRFDNSMARISYYPSRRGDAVEPGPAVPSTFDFDWTADRVPCLPPIAFNPALPR